MASAIEVGAVYSVARSKGFGVVRVLAYKPQLNTIFARVYEARFEERKRGDEISERARDPGVMIKELGMGVGVLPVTLRVFQYWQPEYMFSKEINDEEKKNLEESGGTEDVSPWDDLIYP